MRIIKYGKVNEAMCKLVYPDNKLVQPTYFNEIVTLCEKLIKQIGKIKRGSNRIERDKDRSELMQLIKIHTNGRRHVIGPNYWSLLSGEDFYSRVDMMLKYAS